MATTDQKKADVTDAGWSDPVACDQATGESPLSEHVPSLPVDRSEAGVSAEPGELSIPSTGPADVGDEASPDTSAAAPGELNPDTDVEARAERARDFVEDLLTKMGMNAEAELLEREPDDPPNEVRIEIEGPDSGRVIGKKGQVLAAIQHVINRVVNRPNLERLHVIVDAEGYRQRREDTLATMAQRLGKRALEEGKIITFEPMSPRDRRIVHLALAKFPGVVTKSDGEGEGRRVQIIPVRR